MFFSSIAHFLFGCEKSRAKYDQPWIGKLKEIETKWWYIFCDTTQHTNCEGKYIDYGKFKVQKGFHYTFASSLEVSFVVPAVVGRAKLRLLIMKIISEFCSFGCFMGIEIFLMSFGININNTIRNVVKTFSVNGKIYWWRNSIPLHAAFSPKQQKSLSSSFNYFPINVQHCRHFLFAILYLVACKKKSQ